jgi:Flp pilus assembly protein TadB
VSKERARRRAAREHEAALRTAARAAEQERRERQSARKRAFKAATTDRIRFLPVGQDTGALTRRRRRQTTMVIVVLVCLNILVWVVRPDWQARLAALVVSVLAFPVLRLLLFGNR